MPLYTFTNTNGFVQAYPNGSSGIYIKTGKHITFENCIIHDCGNGFDVQGVDEMVHDVTVRSCHIYGNGRTDSRFDREHNIYTESSGLLFEYNVIGRMRSGAGGSALKDRSANTVYRCANYGTGYFAVYYFRNFTTDSFMGGGHVLGVLCVVCWKNLQLVLIKSSRLRLVFACTLMTTDI